MSLKQCVGIQVVQQAIAGGVAVVERGMRGVGIRGDAQTLPLTDVARGNVGVVGTF